MEHDFGLALLRTRFNDEGFPTKTSEEQEEVEERVRHLYQLFHLAMEVDPEEPKLDAQKHILFLRKYLRGLPSKYECLDASQPWLLYWICHSLTILREELTPKEKSEVAQYLALCQCPDGGFAGGPGQNAHLAPTYAAVLALCTVGTEEAYKVIDREKLAQFLRKVRLPSGSFVMNVDGEEDIRGAFCALIVARLINLSLSSDIFCNTAHWVSQCQTYEGGFGGKPGLEAHGGYTLCGFASLALLNAIHLCDINALLRWAVMRQMSFEGGFQGRTNKLFDGCYSFWVGGIFPLIQKFLSKKATNSILDEHWLFHSQALQECILICCQTSKGGFCDKPKVPADVYHTCNTLCGLSLAQYEPLSESAEYPIAQIHPFINLEVSRLRNALEYFYALPQVA
ncbi:unnamed protein product [Bemisia tabaci]|uniref:Protein farnesyltransferase subunit beta n=1 Tax=Bemisia tabaci TaxID=7038 RepID=A0A9P0F6P0_BEMTA|nr:PREDICTED: protein farnesyltransferase subunit beta [Bemisia tabaci]CAH0392016.1 unnamed protein product [Bemisia tabaci]